MLGLWTIVEEGEVCLRTGRANGTKQKAEEAHGTTMGDTGLTPVESDTKE